MKEKKNNIPRSRIKQKSSNKLSKGLSKCGHYLKIRKKIDLSIAFAADKGFEIAVIPQ